MPSQFFGLNIAGSGLRNSNAALNTTANNISNVQTEGYSRQKVNSEAADALRTFTTYGCAGAGVETLSIERVRDSFYDVKYWNNNSNFGQFEAKEYYCKSIEDYFNDDGMTGFVTVFNKMKDALQSVTTNSSSTSTKAQFVASAEALTDYFNGLYGNLQELQKDINLEIKQCVDQINSISEQIATLNKQINVIELSGSKANDLRDQRDLLIDRLSEFVDVETKETPIYDLVDPTRETGGTRYQVKIAGGQILVDSNDYSRLSCVAREAYEQINQTDIVGLYKIEWDNGNEFNLNNAAMNGKLKGLVEVRDGNNGRNFFGSVSSGCDSKAAAAGADRTVTVKVNSDYLTNMNECALPEKGTIRLNNATYYYKDWTYDNATQEYTFTLDDTDEYGGSENAVLDGVTASNQESIKYQGIPYYMEQMNAFLRSFFKAVNNTFEGSTTTDPTSGNTYIANGVDAYGKAGRELFTCEIKASGHKLTMEELGDIGENPTTGYNGKDDGYYYMTCGNVCISDELLADADKLGSRKFSYNGVEECEQVKKVISMLTNKNEFSFRNASANQMLELVLSDVALNESNANTYKETFNGLKTSIDNQRTSISGVDEDEEAVNLVKYQNAYTLASKMIQTLTEVYDQLILNTGV